MADARPQLLIVDDEFNTRETLMRYLKRKFDVAGAENGTGAIEQLRQRDFDLVLTDLRMPDADGMSVLDAAMSKADKPECILLTAYGSVTDAVEAIKRGAFDFVTKPIKLNKLEEVISAALEKRNSRKNTAAATAADASAVPQVIADTKLVMPGTNAASPMRKLFETALTIAPSKSNVLITGESGTGKEVVARFIHDNSRRKGLFVPVHCAALTATLLESELFGYEKGAFTGAAERRRGRFELADGGTIFLDEIGEIDAATQVKLLRVLESRSFERVGGTETIECDIRLIAATNRNLREMTADGRFREDLFYRLSVINLELPPLRDRKTEIPALVNSFIAEFAAENGKNVNGISPEAMDALVKRRWPGNIRELRNCIESMVVLTGNLQLELSDIPPETAVVISDTSAAERATVDTLNLEASEKELIIKALRECGNNRSAAAKKLGISRRTLYRKLDIYDLEESL